MRKEIKPERTAPGAGGAWKETHPAYGLIGISHVSGGTGPMFGSAVENNMGSIRLTIQVDAERVHTEHGEDRYHARAGGGLVEVALTHAQWVEMISAPNRGNGVPCTVLRSRTLDGVYRNLPAIAPTPPEAEEVIESVRREGASVGAELAGLDARVRAILEAKRIPVSTIRAVSEEIVGVQRGVSGRLPFLASMAVEAAERVVMAGKVEVESYVGAVARRLGFDRIGELAEERAEQKRIAQDAEPGAR